MMRTEYLRDNGGRRKSRPSLAAGLAVLFCVGAALFQLYLGLVAGGLAPEAVLFATLALIFAGLWWVTRRRTLG